jgi:hypothetical protein
MTRATDYFIVSSPASALFKKLLSYILNTESDHSPLGSEMPLYMRYGVSA